MDAAKTVDSKPHSRRSKRKVLLSQTEGIDSKEKLAESFINIMMVSYDRIQLYPTNSIVLIKFTDSAICIGSVNHSTLSLTISICIYVIYMCVNSCNDIHIQ